MFNKKIKIETQFFFSLLSFLIVFSYGCSHQPSKISEKDYSKYKESLIRINKSLVKKDSLHIESYLKRKKWNMTMTGTGLYYNIYQHGQGRMSVQGKIVTILYSVKLLDGTLCYTSDSTGPKRFVIGKGGVEAGLEEGILLLREGDKAHFIMAPHLAHGLVGDDNKIPPRSIIVYDVSVLRIDD